MSPALVQPIAAFNVADAMADSALGDPVNGIVEIAGPERVGLSEIVGRFLGVAHDPRVVVPDVHAHYFGVELNDQSLVPGDDPRLGVTRFEDWLNRLILRT